MLHYPLPDADYDRVMSTPTDELSGDEFDLVQSSLKGQMTVCHLLLELEGGMGDWLRDAKYYIAELIELADTKHWTAEQREVIEEIRAFSATPHRLP